MDFSLTTRFVSSILLPSIFGKRCHSVETGQLDRIKEPLLPTEEICSVNFPVDRSQINTSARSLSSRKMSSVDECLEASYSTSFAEVSDW